VTPPGDAGVRVRVGDVDATHQREATIGRDPMSDVVVDHPLISRSHAALRPTPSGWIIEDHDSRNGLWINGRRVSSAAIGDGLVIQLGAADGPELVVEPIAAPRATSDEIRIGRASDNTIILAGDLLVSRNHARLRLTPDGAELEDLGSHNGTFVNGQRVGRAKVAFGDFVSVGQHRFQLGPSGLHESTGTDVARLVASGLTVRTPTGDTLLAGIDLRVGTRALFAVVGPSGAGKSTLLGALTGLRPADEGSVSVNGRDLYAEYDDLRRSIGLVPQEDVLHPQLTVRKALSYAAALRFPPEVSRAERERRVDEVLAELGLSQRAQLRIDRLSGGQRKRVSVAVELLTKPTLLFLDEPTSGLDPGYERSLMTLLRELADGGRTIVVVTHSVASLHLCDTVLVMAPGGRPAYLGPPADAPAHFGQADYQDVFQALSEPGAVDWPARWAATQRAAAGPPAVRSDVGAPRPPKAALRQFGTLSRRYVSVIRADRTTMIGLIAQAPAIGVLQLAVMPRHELAAPGAGTLRVFSSAAAILLNPVQVATALGLANSIRELVKERGLFRRERAAGLSLPAYLASKVAVLGLVATVQAAILVAFSMYQEGGPHDAVALGQPYLELTAVIALTGIAAMTLGLAISAMASTENVAITMLPVVLVLQNVLSMGGLSPASLEKPVLNQAQYVSSAQWGFAAEAATVDLNHLQGLSAVFKQLETVDLNNANKLLSGSKSGSGQRRYRHDRSVWLVDMAALAALAVVGLLAAGLALSRLDPTAPPRRTPR
jgi:ABC-type multidrug transport system ATPase subunit